MDPTYHEPAGQGPMASPAEVSRLFPGLDLSAWHALESVFPVRITRNWLGRVRSHDGPLGKQVLPRSSELHRGASAVSDPVGEQGQMPVPWVVRKHTDRALLLPTRRCHVHCRYCFRRDLPGERDPSPEELSEAIAYLKAAGLDEVILSGGDPLVLPDARLFAIIDALRPDIPKVRIHTRAPITFPSRVTRSLAEGLQARAPIRVVVHVNHPRELDPSVRTALGHLVRSGLPVLNQSVLLAGINDDAEVLATLIRILEEEGIEPYYLHHTDHAPGTRDFWVDVQRGLEIHAELTSLVERPPRYVIDSPDGSGMVSVQAWAARRPSPPVPFP